MHPRYSRVRGLRKCAAPGRVWNTRPGAMHHRTEAHICTRAAAPASARPCPAQKAAGPRARAPPWCAAARSLRSRRPRLSAPRLRRTVQAAAGRAAERWGLNTVEVLNTNNRTTLGSVNNNKPNVGPGSPTLGQKKWLSLITEPDSNCRLPACESDTRSAKLQTLILKDNHPRLFIMLSFWFDLPP